MRFYNIIGLSLLLAAVFAVVTVYAVSVEEINTAQEVERSAEVTTEPITKEVQLNAAATNEASLPKEVTVKPGDTLARIAEEYEVDYARLFSANEQIEHPDLIEPGDTIRIPAEGEELEPRPLPEPLEPTDEPTPTLEPQPAPVDSDSVWDQLAECESGGNWSANTGNGYYGGLQFSLGSWEAVGGTGYPHEHSREEQIKRGKMLKEAAESGWGQWPHCSEMLGLG